MATPQIPPRPCRPSSAMSQSDDHPPIPPRPKRVVDRSVSPHTGSFARSPLNDPSFIPNGEISNGLFVSDLPKRPASVTLPTIGQEGIEYANIQDSEGLLEQTKNTVRDLPLQAPRPSMAVATGKSRIAGVIRTDSNYSAANTLGKSSSDSDEKMGCSSNNMSTVASSRPGSIYKDGEEHGIPEIGVQVPMYPNAGDVQAPTSSSGCHASTGVGFFHNGNQTTRYHPRSASGRNSAPPGSYGLHGHGMAPQTSFEKDWYDKHPEDVAKEAQGEYGLSISETRKEWAMSSDDLNKLVRDSAQKRIAMGTSSAVHGTPKEHVGYIGAEEYAQRIASPNPPSTKSVNSSSELSPEKGSKARCRAMAAEGSQQADGYNHVIHIDENPDIALHETENLDEERHFNNFLPILAPDEVVKNLELRQPAISLELERPEPLRPSRSPSRSSNLHSLLQGGARLTSSEEDRLGMPLDDVKEYEPLFPEGSDKKSSCPGPEPLEKSRQKEEALSHFPSNDIWEDLPEHHHLVATVATPQPIQTAESAEADPHKRLSTTAPPQTNNVSDGEVENDVPRYANSTDDGQTSFLADHAKGPSWCGSEQKADPNLAGRLDKVQRFPSKDVWEDTPDHQQLIATVAAAESKTEIPSYPDSHDASLKAEDPKSAAFKKFDSQVAASVGKKSEISGPALVKPFVTPRPVNAKFSMTGNASFMNELNNKLNLGPQKKTCPIVPENIENVRVTKGEDKLKDARKGRAKGPAKRKPTGSSFVEVLGSETNKGNICSAVVKELWEIEENGVIVVGDATEDFKDTIQETGQEGY